MLFLRHYVGDSLLKQQRETTRASCFASPRPRLLGVVPRTGHRLSRAPELTSLRPLVQTWFGQPRVHASSQPAVTPPRLRGRRRLPRTQGMPARAQAPGVRAVLPPGRGPPRGRCSGGCPCRKDVTVDCVRSCKCVPFRSGRALALVTRPGVLLLRFKDGRSCQDPV